MIFFQRLQDWQDLKGYSDVALAEKLGVDRTALGRAKRGQTVLRLRHQLALEELSGIKPAEWADFYAQAARARSASGQKKSAPRATPPAEGVA